MLKNILHASQHTILSDKHLKTGRKAPDGPKGYLDLTDGGSITYLPRFFADAEQLFNQVREEVDWDRRKIRIFGKEVYQPRLISYMADDPSLQYTYSGSTLFPKAYSPTILKIKGRLESSLDFNFNCVLCNLYRDGDDYMGWHSDNEQLFGRCPVIGSVSLGQCRAFDIRNNNNYNRLNYHLRYMIGDGDVVVMEGTMQENWKHAVIAIKSFQRPRINLTFRKITLPENKQTNKQTNKIKDK